MSPFQLQDRIDAQLSMLDANTDNRLRSLLKHMLQGFVSPNFFTSFETKLSSPDSSTYTVTNNVIAIALS
jgi:hypothetical protein